MASGEAPEPLKCKTWVLRVSIHCESCNKKVKRILDRIDGVHHTHIDSMRNKVTVTASIDAETLIKKLLKAGKHAELWPELKPHKTPNSPNPNSININNNEKSTCSNPSENPEPHKTPNSPNPNSININNNEKSTCSNPSENPEPKPPSSDSALIATKPAASLTEKTESAAAKKPSETAQTSETTSNPDTTTIKADTEVLNRTNEDSPNSETSESASTSTSPESPGQQPLPLPVVHAYNVVHPSASYAYVATTPMPQGYPPPEAYGYFRDYSEQTLPEFYHQTGSVEYTSMSGYYGAMDPEPMWAPPEGHYDMFSDENANACKVM